MDKRQPYQAVSAPPSRTLLMHVDHVEAYRGFKQLEYCVHMTLVHG